ncbi:MAG: hypothetical protein ABIP16_08075 [Thermomonas sp.]
MPVCPVPFPSRVVSGERPEIRHEQAVPESLLKGESPLPRPVSMPVFGYFVTSSIPWRVKMKMKAKTPFRVALGALLLLPLFAVQAQSPGVGIKVATYSPRAQLVHDIVLKWAPYVKEAYQVSPSAWARGMKSTFAKADIKTLESAANARTYDAMSSRLLGTTSISNSISQAIAVTPEALGDAASDLVFVPVTPCRLFDTRVAGGVIPADGTRTFDITAASNYTAQGGSATNCGVGASGNFAAAMINFTVVTPNGGGYITAYPFLGTQPLAATVNYASGSVVGNVATVKLDQGASSAELSVYSFAQTHLVGDIVGYFTAATKPATALECVETAATTSAAIPTGGVTGITAPTCATGYTQTTTNCRSGSYDMPIVYSSGGVCAAKNNGATSASLNASRTCCRVPAI